MSQPIITMQPDFNIILTNFCQEATFKRYVRDAINTEFFWRDIFQNQNYRNVVDRRVDDKMSNIKEQIKNSTTNLVMEKLESYTKSQLPKNILYELDKQLPDQIQKQLPAYLDRNPKMQEILQAHINQLNTVLYNSAKQTLDQLTNEEQYHSITISHMNSMATRYNEEMSKQRDTNNTKFNDQLASHDKKIEDMIILIKGQATKSLEDFQSFNTKASGFETELKQLKKDMKSSKNAEATLSYVLGVCLMSLIGLGIYVMVK